MAILINVSLFVFFRKKRKSYRFRSTWEWVSKCENFVLWSKLCFNVLRVIKSHVMPFIKSNVPNNSQYLVFLHFVISKVIALAVYCEYFSYCPILQLTIEPIFKAKGYVCVCVCVCRCIHIVWDTEVNNLWWMWILTLEGRNEKESEEERGRQGVCLCVRAKVKYDI